jgi:hypothetical protein
MVDLRAVIVLVFAACAWSCTTEFESPDAEDSTIQDSIEEASDQPPDQPPDTNGADGYDILIEPGSEPTVIIDNTSYQPEFDVVGEWMELSSDLAYLNEFLYAEPRPGAHVTPDATATFRPNLPQSGLWAVFIWWPHGDDRATDTNILIHHAEGTALRVINLTINGGQWRQLGVFRFNEGNEGIAVIQDSITGYTNADAMGFLYMSP